MRLINKNKQTYSQGKTIPINFRQIFINRSNHLSPQSHHNHSQQNDNHLSINDPHKYNNTNLHKIQDLLDFQRELKEKVRVLDSIQYSKRFSRLTSLKKMRTQGDEVKQQNDYKRVSKIGMNNLHTKSYDMNEEQRQSSGLRSNDRSNNKKDRSNRKEVNVSIKKIDFYDVNEETNQLNDRLNALISQKLSKLSKILKYKQKIHEPQPPSQQNNQNFYNDLNDLIHRIKKLKKKNPLNDIQFLSHKIQFIQSLIAQNTTQSQLIKKYYYYCCSKKKGPLINHHFQKANKKYDLDSYKYQQKSVKIKPFFGQATSKQTYKFPKKQFYSLQKSKKQQYESNNQPFPRSSYNRDFLKIHTIPTEVIQIPRMNTNILPNYTTTLKSRYTLDYKTQQFKKKINYRQLDAYQDKLKFLPISFLPEKQKEQNQFQQLQVENKEQETNKNQHTLLKNKVFCISNEQSKFDKIRFITQSRKQFGWQRMTSQKSRIKHKKLKQFQYRLKNIYKS